MSSIVITPQPRHALVYQNGDGTMSVTFKPRGHSKAIPIIKLPHGRLSVSPSGIIQLTLKFNHNEDGIPHMINEEASEAALALFLDQL